MKNIRTFYLKKFLFGCKIFDILEWACFRNEQAAQCSCSIFRTSIVKDETSQFVGYIYVQSYQLSSATRTDSNQNYLHIKGIIVLFTFWKCLLYWNGKNLANFGRLKKTHFQKGILWARMQTRSCKILTTSWQTNKMACAPSKDLAQPKPPYQSLCCPYEESFGP